MIYYLNIGSNLGVRNLNLSRAVSAIEKEFGSFELSKQVESEPWGFDSSNKFLNIGMLVQSDKEPLEVLGILKRIEKSISPASHRKADGSYADRLIDIDIMAVENPEAADGRYTVTMDTAELTLPHPGLQDRPFFIEPFQQLLELRSKWNESDKWGGKR